MSIEIVFSSLFSNKKSTKMTFGINGPDNHIPAIQQTAHTSDGGAGNLGYFQQQKKKKEEKEEEDIFEFSSKEKKEDPLMDELDSIGQRIKDFWNNLNGGNEKFIKENPFKENP